ncbi:YusW family protein [Sporosarcina jiandibaonis]|uniref:YusW family protein n=1 Tax=Sporosarcina jiandibaonis TaxID=2715535 RepID=UPI0015568C37|nr:YusW family protein [Sporosarcina jiandibaonis]
MKKHTVLFIVLLCSLLIVGACNNRNIVTNTEDEGDKKSLGSKYGFTFLDLSADTNEMKEALKVTYDEKKDKTEAMYENKIDDFYLHGNAAMEKLDEIFEELALDPEMDDEDMIKKASEAFEINDYKSLKLDVKFKGFDTKKLRMTK